MKITVPAALGALVVGVTLSGTLAFAQDTGLTVNVPFSFAAEGKTLPAGRYEITEQDPLVLTLSSQTRPATQVLLPVITRLASSRDASDSKVVFDKIGDKDVLSEVWIGDRDGYLVYATKGAHTHESVHKKQG